MGGRKQEVLRVRAALQLKTIWGRVAAEDLFRMAPAMDQVAHIATKPRQGETAIVIDPNVPPLRGLILT